MKRNLLTMAALLTLTATASASDFGEFGNYNVFRVSNPYNAPGDVDGLMPGGFRENSYTWRMAMRGDEIYVATARNLANGVMNLIAPSLEAQGVSNEMFWSMVDAVTNGDIPHDSEVAEGANIISYNRVTGEMKVIYTAERYTYFRMAVTFGDNVYFGSYSSIPTMPQYILKLDKDGNFTKVFETYGSVSMRANCEYEGHLYFAGADAREEVDPSETATPSKMAVLCKSNEDDSQWDRVADYKDFGYLPFDPIMSNTTGCPIWELATHNGYIYASSPSSKGMVIFRGHPAQGDEPANEYGWYWEEIAGLTNGVNYPGLGDDPEGKDSYRSVIGSVFEFNGELYAYDFDNTISAMIADVGGMFSSMAGSGMRASQFLAPMYTTLNHPQHVWKLNDATGKFEECLGFTELMEGTTNEYIWRMGVHNGKLYISTMDSGVCYGWLTQLTNGSFFLMNAHERATKIEYINNLIRLLSLAAGNAFVDQLIEKLQDILYFLENYQIEVTVNENFLNLLNKYAEMLENLKNLINSYINGGNDEDVELLAQAIMAGDTEFATQLAEFAQMPENYVEGLRRAGDLNAGLSNLLTAAFGKIVDAVQDLIDRIDVEGIKMYVFINRTVMSNEWGFDLIRTTDGVNFEVVTRDGFGDRYNYGCPSFLSTKEGMYIGTCNPFYGCQLYLLVDNDPIPDGVNDVRTNAEQRTDVYYTTTGIRINGVPTEPGIYVNDGRKVIIGK